MSKADHARRHLACQGHAIELRARFDKVSPRLEERKPSPIDAAPAFKAVATETAIFPCSREAGAEMLNAAIGI